MNLLEVVGKEIFMVAMIILFAEAMVVVHFENATTVGGMINHVAETYWELYGKPYWANYTNIQEEKLSTAELLSEKTLTLSKENYRKLQALLKDNSPE